MMILRAWFFFLLFSGAALYAQQDAHGHSYLKELTTSAQLTSSFAKLERIKSTTSAEKYTVVHFGDSHVQGDAFSGEIRRLLQDEYGYAGQGVIFPYSLSKSFGPKGVVATTKGLWVGSNLLSDQESSQIGTSGYVLKSTQESAQLSFEINDKFTGKTANKIAIWTSADSTSFDYQVNSNFRLVSEVLAGPNIKVRTYESNAKIDRFTISLLKHSEKAQQFYFHGFEFISASGGVDYHRCGVVGAQFTHLVNHAGQTKAMLKQLNPDVIIFSFGSNEAYNQKMDIHYYYRLAIDFILQIRKVLPQAAVIITTAPDTRSQGRIPPSQVVVNEELVKLADNLQVSMYDLYQAMGGWGSMYSWHSNKLANDDKLHFGSRGYTLQAKMLIHAFFAAYNKASTGTKVKLAPLEADLAQLLKPLLKVQDDRQAKENVVVQAEPASAEVKTASDTTQAPIVDKAEVKDDEKIDPRPVASGKDKAKPKSKPKPKSVVYVVKSGDVVSKIANKYKVSVDKILKANRLKEQTIIRPGQKIVIPKN